jgi:hypothetical protein
MQFQYAVYAIIYCIGVIPNILSELLPDDASFHDVAKVCDIDGNIQGRLEIMADIVEQRVVCVFSR